MKNNIEEKNKKNIFIYEYDEDSKLLEECFKKKLEENIKKIKKDSYEKKSYSIIEVGFGNGELLKKLFLKYKDNNIIKKIYGTDINPYAIKKLKENLKKSLKGYKTKKIVLKQTEYTNNIKEQFDFILFNPPYLPESKEDKYLTYYEKKAFIGGKKGIETTIKFLKKIKKNLKENTQIFIIASSHSDIKLLEYTINNEGYNIIKKKEKKLPYEKIYCYILKPNLALKYAIKNKYDLEYYDRGKRSIIYMIKKQEEKNKIIKYAIKEKNTDLKKEYKILNLLYRQKKIKVPKPYIFIEKKDIEKKEEKEEEKKKEKIMDKTIKTTEKIIIMQYIEGLSTKEITNKKDKKRLYKKLLEYAILLDTLKLKKEEFTRPYTNVIITKKNVYLIDFERTKKEKTGNLNQLLDYYRKNNLIKVKEIKKIVLEYEEELKLLEKIEEKSQIQNFIKKWYLKIVKTIGL